LTHPARFSRTAQREFARALEDLQHAAAAARLKRVVAEAARRLGERPLLGRREPALAGARYRFWSVAGFPYVIVYRPDTVPPSIVRFVHTSRDLPRVLADLKDAPDLPDTDEPD
jgi:toxin ParE1/3/4